MTHSKVSMWDTLRNALSTYHDQRTVRVAGAIAVGYLLCSVLLARTPGSLSYVEGLVPVLAVLFGPAAALGAVLGVLLSDLFFGAVGPWTAVSMAWLFSLAAITDALSRRSRAGNRTIIPRMNSARRIGRYVAVVLVASVCAVAVAAWISLLVSVQPVFTGFGAALTKAAVAVVAGPVVFALLGFVVRRRGVSSDTKRVDLPGGRPTNARLVGVFGVSTIWLLAGTGLGVVTDDFRLAGLEAAQRFVPIGGILGSILNGVIQATYLYGDVIVIVFGGVAAIAIAAVVRGVGVRGGMNDRKTAGDTREERQFPHE